MTKRGKELWLFMSKDKFEVQCYDLDTKSLVRTIKPETDTPNLPYTSAGIWNTATSDGAVFGANTNKFRMYDGATGKILGTLPPDLWDSSAGFLPGGQLYLARPTSKDVSFGPNAYVIFDWNTGKPIVALTGHGTGKDPRAAASGDGKTVVSVTEEGELLVFDLAARS